ncbi:MAG TPA: alpha/beta hydrolase, partial [Terrimicrobiaceae bacterium]|nr:alpha/beta hydrolase [Terrimicrobiaceae bacterium]
METIPLWPDLGGDGPTLDIYEPFGTAFRGAAMLIFPGGGYGHLSAQEGEGYAGVFQLWGFKAFVCNYRLGSQGHRHPAMIQDAQRALRIIRSRADEFAIDPHRIGAIGSSAGGHLAATLLTHPSAGIPGHADPVERASARPDLGILCYPVITMGEDTHSGSRTQLLGPDPSPELIAELSADRRVTEETPPCFVWHTRDDPAVPVENAYLFVRALGWAGVPYELHIYESGAHGLGMKDGIPWTEDCRRWLRRRLLAPGVA